MTITMTDLQPTSRSGLRMRALPLQLLVGLVVLATINVGVIDSQRYLLSKKPGCNKKGQRQLELTFAKLMSLGEFGRPFPENNADVKAYCKETERLIQKADSFLKKCYRKEVSDLAGLIVYSIKNTIKRFCRRRTKKLNRLMRVTPCLNEKLRRDDSCLVRFVNETKKFIDLRDHTTKIPYTCCAFFDSLDCMDRTLDSTPCARDYKSTLFEFISGLYSNLADVMCSDYDPSTDRCSRLAPITDDKFTRIKSAANNTYISFPVALIDLFESV